MNQEISIRAVSELTGVTSRTLRHYEQIGLLRPSSRTNTGERFYSELGLLRLQQILILKNLGLGLEDISKNLDSAKNSEWLRIHNKKLKQQITNLEKQVSSVQATIERLEKGEPLVPHEIFEGFQNDPYQEEAQELWPDKYRDSQQNLKQLSPDRQKAIFAETTALQVEAATLMREGSQSNSPAVKELISRHYKWICNFWTPSKEAYISLGEMYASDPRFAANYDKHEVGLSVFMREAMTSWASENLG